MLFHYICIGPTLPISEYFALGSPEFNSLTMLCRFLIICVLFAIFVCSFTVSSISTTVLNTLLLLLYLAIIYWMRLSKIWRILQVKEGVISPSEICRILHIIWKPDSKIALLFIQNIFFAQTCKPIRSHFATSFTGFLGQWLNNLQWDAFLMSSVEYDKNSLQIWSTAAAYGELYMWF